MSEKVMLFFEDVDDPSRESVDRRKKEFVALKSRIPIGEDYDSVKSKLKDFDPMKMECTSYTEYELSPLIARPDGRFQADCSFIVVSCFCGPDDPELCCRMYFDQRKKLLSIEYLEVSFVSYKQVRHLYDQEDYPAAYRLANEAHHTNPDLKWPMHILPWLLIHLMKANARAYSQRKFLSLLEEFKALGIPEDNKKLWGAVAWPIRDIVKDSIAMQWFTPEFGDELFTAIWVMPFDRPSESYSSLMKEFVRLGGLWPRLPEFIEWWGFDSFTNFDYRRYPENGALESLVEKVMTAYLVSLHRGGERRHPSEAFYKALDNLALRSKEQADRINKILSYRI